MLSRLILVSAVACAGVWADFSYEQTSKMTGGAAAGMMKIAGAFSKAAREPIQSTVMVKNDRMANVSRDRIHVIDLNTETISDIDLARKTWSKTTFAEMAEAMQKTAEKMGQKEVGGDMSFRVEVKQTGTTKVISGIPAKEMILTLTLEGTDKKTGDKGSLDMEMEMWIAPDMPSYGEVKDFYRRMAQKVSWNPMTNAIGPMMAQNAKGMSEMAKQMSKLDGVPLLQIMKIGVGAGEANSPSPSQTSPTATDAATQAAVAGAFGRAGRIGALAGGLGGFGRKKKAESEQASPVRENPSSANSSGALMELTTELTAFSSANLDASKFDVPAGFRQVESDMKKALNR